MRFFVGLLMCLSVVSVSAHAGSDGALTVLKNIKINGVGLTSTREEVQAAMDAFGKVSVRCEHTRTPQRIDHRKRISPLRERWTCTDQATQTPGVWRRLAVTYAHNRVVSIDYEGSILPEFGGVSAVKFIEGLNDKFSAVSDLGDAYSYQGFQETPGASSQYLTQNLSLNMPQTCKIQNDHEVNYKAGATIGYNEIPSQGHKGIKLKLFNDESNQCFRTLGVAE